MKVWVILGFEIGSRIEDWYVLGVRTNKPELSDSEILAVTKNLPEDISIVTKIEVELDTPFEAKD